ncbi:MAG TPA: hypothetical protein VFE25_13695 [Opitutaceae bacterium]|jgi:hypothetical protein|nr:hypothetical protein [Opitutaceae bacterium]
MRHNLSPARLLAAALLTLSFAVLLAGPGCRTTDDEMTNAVVAGVRPVAMEGNEAFFSGKLSVKVTISRGIGQGLKKHGRDERDAFAKSDTKQFAGNPVPPVTLHLYVTNTSGETVTVNLIDFNSDLGNFAIDPDKLTIEAGQIGEPTPMVSDLGVTSDTIAFSVTLKLGGVKETKMVTTRSVLTSSDAASPQK